MGHAFNQTIMDGLVRYHRMRGDDTMFVPGTDHAGIATQIVVERRLDADKISRHDLGREKFVEKVWEWNEQSGNTITSQVRRSEERRGGKECVSTCRSRGSPDHKQKKTNTKTQLKPQQ